MSKRETVLISVLVNSFDVYGSEFDLGLVIFDTTNSHLEKYHIYIEILASKVIDWLTVLKVLAQNTNYLFI